MTGPGHAVVYVAAAVQDAPALPFMDRNPTHGQPRSIKETRRSQKRGRR